MTTRHTRRDPRDGYVIFAVLMVVVVLSLVAYRFTDAMTAEYRAAARSNDAAQAKLAAVSGLHYAAAVLSDRDTFASELDANPFDNGDVFERVEVAASAAAGPRRKVYFDIRCVAMTGPGTYEQRFGVIDEGGKLNINSMIALDPTGDALYNALLQLPNMTADVADAIVDWVDADDTPRASGAETADYQGMTNPYNAKNGPLNSLDELLLVKGVTPDLLYGGDRNRNGVYDDGDTGGDRGWADYLTVYGRELNVASDGQVRTYLNGDDLTTLQGQLGGQLDAEMTAYIMAAKLFTVTATDASGNPSTGTSSASATATASSGTSGATATATASGSGTGTQQAVTTATADQIQTAIATKMAATFTGGNRVKSLADLMYSRITLPTPADAPKGSPPLVAMSPLLDPTKRAAILPTLLDRTTVKQPVELVPRINVNTAPREVLLGVPGMTADMADAVVAARASVVPTDPAYASAAWLLTAAGIDPTTYKSMEKYVTGRTMVYRVQAVGYLDGGTGPVARMEAVIDTNQGAPRFLLVRDLSDLDSPRGFDPNSGTSP